MGKNQIKENGKKEKKTVWTVKELMNGEYEKKIWATKTYTKY